MGLVLLAPCSGAQEVNLANADLYEELRKDLDEDRTPGRRLPSVPLSCLFYTNVTVDFVSLDDDRMPKVILTSVQTTMAGYHLYPSILHFSIRCVRLR